VPANEYVWYNAWAKRPDEKNGVVMDFVRKKPVITLRRKK
jgi:hypothetical protein